MDLGKGDATAGASSAAKLALLRAYSYLSHCAHSKNGLLVRAIVQEIPKLLDILQVPHFTILKSLL